MREILFKAKRKDNGEFVAGDLLHTGDIDTVLISDCYGRLFRCDSTTICQYTGLTDKNGKKIWENDICIIEDGTLDKEDGYFVCKWDDNTARYILDGYGLTVDFDNVNTWDVEVIGNIFDNQDLLEVE